MKPKSRKDILNICWSNFSNYSTISKIFIIISVILSAATIAFYISRYIYPTIQGIVCGDIIGWDIVWRCCLVYLLHYVVMFINLIFVSIGGSAMCREENWDVKDFSIAWTNMYEYVNNNNLEL
jgi:hypothetical protein